MDTNYAGFGKRFVAYMIDGFILMIPFMLLGFLAGSMLDPATILSGTASLAGIGLFYLGLFIISMGYFVYFESSEKQATPGKSMMNIKVTDTNGNRLSVGKALLRNLMKIVSGIIFYIGFIMAAFTKKKQALHDMAADAVLLDVATRKELNTTV